MKKIFFLLSFGFLLESSAQTSKDNIYAKKIINLYNQVIKYSDKYEKENLDKYLDSISKYNSSLKKILLQKDFRKLSRIQINKIINQTGIRISESKNNLLRIVSWCINGYSGILQCNAIGIINQKRSRIFSISGEGMSDFGDDLVNDSIIQFPIKGKTYYVLFGSKKCGNLCILKSASVYTIRDDNIQRCKDSFFDGSKYIDKVEFTYLINEQTKIGPSFNFENGNLICPVFDEDKVMQVDTNVYKIIIRQ